MRGLIIFSIVSLAAAVPQGYNYPLNHDQQYSLDTPLIEDSLRALSFPGEELRRPFATYGVHPQHKQSEVLISKKFFIHSAPDEEDEEVPEKIVSVGQHKKNYNVVFIRAPTKMQKPATLKIIPAVKEEKTVVYVLSKKDAPLDIHTSVDEAPTTTTKPEVYFIKYKTPEEADHAQSKIQAEYEHLGGSTQVLHEVVSPVSSVIGSLQEMSTLPEGGAFSAPSSGPALEEFPDVSLNSGYLPPNKK